MRDETISTWSLHVKQTVRTMRMTENLRRARSKIGIQVD